MEKPDVGTICNNLLGVDNIVLGQDSAESCLDVCPRSLIRWSCLDDFSLFGDGFSVTGHNVWKMWPELSVKHFLIHCHRTGSIIRKTVPMRHFCNKVSHIHNFFFFFLKKGRPWINTRFQIRVQPLFAFKKREVHNVL